MCLIIASRLRDVGEEFDVERIVSAAVIHDMEEIGTGDIPRPTKHANPRILEEMESLGREFMGGVTGALGTTNLYMRWEGAKKGKNGSIVALCDGLSVLFKVWQEAVLHGNLTIVDHVGPVRDTVLRLFTTATNYCETIEGRNILGRACDEALELAIEVAQRSYQGEY